MQDDAAQDKSVPRLADLVDLIFRDELTGLFNRRYLRNYFKNNVAWDAPAEPFAVLMIDVDEFKRINDTYGHNTGDAALTYVAGVLRQSFPQPAVVVRHSGDEFVVVLPDTDGGDALSRAQELNECIRKGACRHQGQAVSLTLSIGVAAFPADGTTPGALLESADRALYAAKNAGRDQSATADDVSRALSPRDALLSRFPCPTFVGRSDLMAEVSSYLPDMTAHATSFVLLAGAPGVGKTRLLGRLAERVVQWGMSVVSAVCDEKSTGLPYACLCHLLRQAMKSVPDAMGRTVSRLAHAEQSLLVELLPELPEHCPLTLVDLSWLTPEARRKSLAHALHSLLVNISRIDPLVLLLDDIQHVDEASLRVLRSVADDPKARLGVFGTMCLEDRADEGGRSPLDRVLSASGDAFQRIEIAPLPPGDALAMIAEILPGRPVDRSFDAAMAAACRGNPLQIEEVLKTMLVAGALEPVGSTWRIHALPDEGESSAKTVAARLQTLDAETRRMLQDAAVAGTVFDIDLIRETGGTNEGHAMDLLDKAREVSLVMPHSETEFEFAGPTIRRQVYDTIDATSRREIHERIARLEERRHAEDLDAASCLLLHHYTRAGNKAKASEYADRLAEAAGLLYLPGDAKRPEQRSGEPAPAAEAGPRTAPPAKPTATRPTAGLDALAPEGAPVGPDLAEAVTGFLESALLDGNTDIVDLLGNILLNRLQSDNPQTRLEAAHILLSSLKAAVRKRSAENSIQIAPSRRHARS